MTTFTYVYICMCICVHECVRCILVLCILIVKMRTYKPCAPVGVASKRTWGKPSFFYYANYTHYCPSVRPTVSLSACVRLCVFVPLFCVRLLTARLFVYLSVCPLIYFYVQTTYGNYQDILMTFHILAYFESRTIALQNGFKGPSSLLQSILKKLLQKNMLHI